LALVKTAFPLAPAAVLAVLLGSFSACQKKETPPPAATVSTFDRVSSQLDSGGDFYLYLRTEQALTRVPAEMDEWKTAIFEAAGPGLPMPREQAEAYYQVFRQAVVDTGVTQLRAFGMSSIELEPGLSRSKLFAFSGEQTSPGLLWRLGGHSAPHAIAALDFLPANTVYAGFNDFDPTAVWEFVHKIAEQIPDEAVRNQVLSMESMATPVLGMSIPDLLGTIDSEVGVVVTAEETATMVLPMGSKPLNLPRMAVAILVRVKDDRFYNFLAGKIEGMPLFPVKKSDADGLRTITVDVPASGLPLKPVVARFGNYVAIATSPELVQQLARKGANLPPLLKDAPAFKRLADREKLEANAFGYLSERGATILRTIQLHSLDADAGIPPLLRPRIERFYELFSQKFVFALGRIGPDGYSTVSYSSAGTEQMLAAAAIVPAGIMAAVAIPAVSASAERAKATKALVDLRQVDAALKQYEAQSNPEPGAVINPADLVPFVEPGTDLATRMAATPFVDPMGNPYSELVAGSPPHVPQATADAYPKLRNTGFWQNFGN
jgi:type II secretory pathway pseudopilin PulG